VIPRITVAIQKLRRHVAREEGLALVLGLGFSVVLAIAGTTTVVYTTGNQRSAHHSKAARATQSLAEAGLHYAYATLYNSSTPTMPGAVPEQTVSVNGGTVTYSGTLNGETWTLKGVGRFPNPTGAADLVRTNRGEVSIGSSQQGTGNNAIWNYLYADSTTTCMQLRNSVSVNAPLYVRGDLCLQNSATVTGPVLQVGGTIQLENSSTLGSSGAGALDEIHVGGGCRLGTSGQFTSPCGPDQRVYGDVVDASPSGLVKPPVDLAGWYQNALPGPMHGCTTGSFPGGFDNDTTMNRSRANVRLLSPSSYDCRVYDGQGALIGQLTWDATAHQLTILGTVFFDGDIVFENSDWGVYSGRGTIYTSGRVEFINSNTLCGISGCDGGWNPSENLLAFVAGSSTDEVGVLMRNSTTFQGAVYAVTDYKQENSVIMWGPVISRQLHLENSTENHYVPLGTLLEGMPATYEEVVALVNEPGSWE
jgi:hypothetical protein